MTPPKEPPIRLPPKHQKPAEMATTRKTHVGKKSKTKRKLTVNIDVLQFLKVPYAIYFSSYD
jgi:hypothetical protein